ncbi:PREDICTED: uncharacterized protein LOC105143991 isoform X1 [Acromyrmex echinatior]|uniref:uncharacterized protein LOC105143991 isoform X1 n=1 Tax=Acromyrmex echinatior TaxID=103372 RepID=UPI0005810879|nr:PREDICTED: uncharacterized protein LOC105143991 isoform X1 [Acromyrmex echinatior]
MDELEKEYIYNNIIYKVFATRDVHNSLQNDPNFFTTYFIENMPSQEAICVSEKVSIFTWTKQAMKFAFARYRLLKPSIGKIMDFFLLHLIFRNDYKSWTNIIFNAINKCKINSIHVKSYKFSAIHVKNYKFSAIHIKNYKFSAIHINRCKFNVIHVNRCKFNAVHVNR